MQIFINTERVVALTKRVMGIVLIKVTIIILILHYVIPFLKRVKIYESHCSFKFVVSLKLYFTLFDIVNVFMNYIFGFFKLKLTILGRVGNNTQNLLRLQIFLFFSEALSMYNKITNENTDNSAT